MCFSTSYQNFENNIVPAGWMSYNGTTITMYEINTNGTGWHLPNASGAYLMLTGTYLTDA